MHLPALTDDELLRHAQAEHDVLTSSILETELIRRFALIVDFQPLAKVLDDYSIESPSDLEKILETPQEIAGVPIGELQNLFEEHEIRNAPAAACALEMYAACDEHDIDTVEELRRQLDRIRTFDGVMNDLVGPLKTLTELAPA